VDNNADIKGLNSSLAQLAEELCSW